MTISRNLFFLIAFALVLPMQIGCDSADPENGEENLATGRYTLQVRGELPGASSGTASFMEIPADGEDGPGFIIELSGITSAQDTVKLGLIRGSKRPGAGTYRFGNAEDGESSELFMLLGISLQISSETGARGYAIGSTSGTLKLLTSSPERVSGTFSVEAAGTMYDETGEQEVAGTYVGEFDARPCPADSPECDH